MQPYSITSDEKRPNLREFEGLAKGMDGSASQPARSFPISVVGSCLQVVCGAAYLRTRCGSATPGPDKKNPAEAGFSLVAWDGDALWGVPSSLLLLRHGVEGGRVEAGACTMTDSTGFLTVWQTNVAADDLATLDCVNLTALGHEMPGRR